MNRTQPIDFVRFVRPYIRDTYEMRGTRRTEGREELIWWHPNMENFHRLQGMSKKDISLFGAMNIVVNEAYRQGHIRLAPIEDPEGVYYVVDIVNRSHYLSARSQVVPLTFTFQKENAHETDLQRNQGTDFCT